MKSQATLEEVQAYCVEVAGLEKSDGEYIWLHWEENGWTRAGKKIKDWKRCILIWKLGGYFPSQRKKFSRKLPSATEVRRVIRDHRDRMVGCREPDEAWERIFRSELACSYQDAMKVLK